MTSILFSTFSFASAHAGCKFGDQWLDRSISSNTEDYDRFFTMTRGGEAIISVIPDDGDELSFYLESPDGNTFCHQYDSRDLACAFHPVSGKYWVRIENLNDHRVRYEFSCVNL